jgi:hypothetical protein
MNERLTHSPSGRGSFLPAGASGFLARAIAVVAGGLILVAGLFVSAVVIRIRRGHPAALTHAPHPAACA